MQSCPSCGHANPAGSPQCAQCGRSLVTDAAASLPPAGTPTASAVPPPPVPFPGGPVPVPPGAVPYGVPIPMHPPVPRGHNVGFFFLGLGAGILAVLLAIFGTSYLSSSQYGFSAPGLTYLGCIPAVAALVGMIVCLSIRKYRFIGYGLLAVVVGAPVIFAISCIVILSGSSLFHP